MKSLADVQLVLYFTRGVGLQTWHESGMFEREVAHYLALRPFLKSITFVTHGTRADMAFQDQLQGIRIICNEHDLPEKDYLAALLQAPPVEMRGPVIFKSNQVWGAEIPLQAARKFGARCIARCGYLFSDFMERQHGYDSQPARQARILA